MHVTIMALGSFGDVYPFILLGAALRRAGCEVRLATFETFAELAVKHALSFHAVEGDAAALMQGSAGVALAEAGLNIGRMLSGVRKSFGAQAEAYGRAFGQAALRETDVIVNQLPGGLYAADVAEKGGLPLIQGSVIPMTRTRAFPMVAFPTRGARLPGYNLLTYRLAEQLVWGLFRKAVNRWRREALGLALSPFLRAMHLPGTPVLNAFSRHVVPRPADWGTEVRLTGYWFPPEDNYEPPDALRRFLEKDPPPIFIGFGSMPVRHPQQTTALLLEAVQRSGQRAILHSGWAQLAGGELPADVMAIDYAPYGWLFPRVAGVVHHGGSGTTAHGVLAGTPGMAVPFLFDQFFWGRRLEALGVGLAPLPFKDLSATRLAEALDRLAHDAGMRQRAAALAAKVRTEQGLETAVAVVREVGSGGSRRAGR